MARRQTTLAVHLHGRHKSYASPESDKKYGFGTHLIIQIRVWQKRGQISGPFYREVLSGQAFCRQRPCVS